MAAILKTCFLNGAFQDIESASIPVMDRGFIFGDAVYEVIPVFNGVAFHLDLHLQRLAQSLEAIQIPAPHSDARWSELIYELIQSNGLGNQSIYLQVTRGVAARDHAIPPNLSPTVFMFSSELPQNEVRPIAAIVAEDTRWQHCDIKATSLLANVLLRTQALKYQAAETILFRDGFLTEGAASNVFVVINDIVHTSRKNKHILAGITRRLLIDMLEPTAFRVVEKDISEASFREASEIWITSSSKDLVPVTKLDGENVGSGAVGRVFPVVLDLFQTYKNQWLTAQAQALTG